MIESPSPRRSGEKVPKADEGSRNSNLASPDFWHLFYELPSVIQKRARENYELLKDNPRHPSLHLKKAAGIRGSFVRGGESGSVQRRFCFLRGVPFFRTASAGSSDVTQ